MCSASSSSLGGGGEYHPITPIRAYDSRFNDDLQPLIKDQPMNLKIVGLPGMPAAVDADGDTLDDNVIAVAANVTVANPVGAGHIKTTPAGQLFSDTAIGNFKELPIAPNFALLRPGTNGETRFVIEVGASAHVIVDVFGYFTSCDGARGGRVIPVGPGRLLDTRAGAPIGPNSSIPLMIRGADSVQPPQADIVPNDPNVVGVVINVAGINNRPDAQLTHVSITPTQAPSGGPATANLNVWPGAIRANLAFVPVGPDGNIWLYNNAGTIDLTVDLVAIVRNGANVATTEGRVVPLTTQYRALDTRRPEFGAKRLGPGAAETWSFERTINSVATSDGRSVGPQLGMIANFTAIDIQRLYPTVPISTDHLSVYPPAVRGEPSVATVNLAEGQNIPNLALLRYGADSSVLDGNGAQMCAGEHCLKVFNAAGYADYVLDMQAVILK